MTDKLFPGFGRFRMATRFPIFIPLAGAEDEAVWHTFGLVNLFGFCLRLERVDAVFEGRVHRVHKMNHL
jgi:hypothetical protein